MKAFLIKGEDIVAAPNHNDYRDRFQTAESPWLISQSFGGSDSDRIAGLEAGADDYLPKPFEPKELILRIQNILKKTKKSDVKRIIEIEEELFEVKDTIKKLTEPWGVTDVQSTH